MEFLAEVKKVESKKLASLDIGYTVTLYTDDPSVLSLGAIQGDSVLKVTIEVQE